MEAPESEGSESGLSWLASRGRCLSARRRIRLSPPAPSEALLCVTRCVFGEPEAERGPALVWVSV